MSNKPQKQQSTQSIAWWFFTRGYLRSTKRNVEEIKSFLKKNRIAIPKSAADLNKKSTHNNSVYMMFLRDDWFPTIFMIRHAVELTLKSVSKKLYKDFYKTHNLDSLMNYVKQGKLSNFLEEDVKELERLSKKYLAYEFDGNSIVQPSTFKDEMNMLFRYPENYNGPDFVRLDFTYFNEMTVKKVNDILKDIHNLDKISTMETIPDGVESSVNFGIPIEKVKKQIRKNMKRKGLYIKK